MNEKNTPLVSVYITTKNRPDMLKRALNSVLAQTYKSIEIIVSDDGSTDHTPELMSSYVEKHHNIVYLRSSDSKGACHARNKAILKAKGVFITGLDDDDRFTSTRVERFIGAYKEGVSFICSLSYHFNGSKYLPSHYYQRYISKNDIFRRNCIGNQIFVKRQDLLDHGIFFDESLPAWQDYDFFTRLICQLGQAKRVYARTYIIHTDHEKSRITSPKRTRSAYGLYLRKHKLMMSKSQRVSLAINALVLQQKSIPRILKLLCIKYLNLFDLFKILKMEITR